MIKAVLFDVDGTLLDSFEANLKFYHDLAIKTGYTPPPRERHAQTFHLTMREKVLDMTGLEDEQEIQRIVDIGKSDAMPYDHSLLRLADGAQEIISALKKQYFLGIVTGRIKANIFEFPDFEKLSHHFSTVVGYEDTELHKPHPDPLLFAAEQLAVAPDACVYIGDVENDMIAAHAAGMKGIHFTSSSIFHGDAQVKALRDICDVITRW